ncbi:hypothetical protein JD969_15675 [Planctomycetota bacterium]|nr:hypothetical protein JD969_15675 [Planctomycetota bacterium]
MPVNIMRRRLGLIAFTICLTISMWSAASFAAEKPEAHGDEKLEHAMEEMQTLIRALGKSMREEGKEQQSADLIQQMIPHAIIAKSEYMHVHAIEDASPAEQPKLINDYRIKLNDAIIGLAQAENALLAGNKKQAAQYLTDVKTAQRAGHKAYKED